MGRGGQNLTRVLTVTPWWLLWGLQIGGQDRSWGTRTEATALSRWEMMGLDHDEAVISSQILLSTLCVLGAGDMSVTGTHSVPTLRVPTALWGPVTHE